MRVDARAAGRADGVNVVGYFSAEAGVGEAARLLLETLEAAELPHAVVPYGETLSRQNIRFERARNSSPSYGTTVACVNADEFARYVAGADPSLFKDRYVVAMWWWEVERFPKRMASAALLVDEVWVGSRHTAAAITREVDVPVHVVPPPIVPPRRVERSRVELGLPEDYLFLFAFDFLSVFERKNPLAVVDAFTRAFAPTDGATLVLRSINGERAPQQLAQLRAAAAGRTDVRVLDGYLDAEVQYAVVAACDAYVSLHRAEGFGLTLAEAMALGKPAIATGYSGNLEFMTHENSFLVPYRLVPIGHGRDPYPPDALWAEPDVDEAARLMRRVFERPDDARAVGERARLEIASRHSPAMRAGLIRRRVAEIAASRPRARPDPRDVAGELVRRAAIEALSPVERAAVLLSGGPMFIAPSRRGRIGNAYRRLVLAALRHYRHHEQTVAARLVDAATLRRAQLLDLRRHVDADVEAATSGPTAFWRGADRNGDGRTRFRIGSASVTLREVVAGTETAVRTRRRSYIPRLASAQPVLDVSCGRGELLDLLREAGVSARGAETDGESSNRARGKGHDVRALAPGEFLAAEADGAAGAVAACGVVNRLGFRELVDVLSLAARKLRPGGLLLVESANPHSFRAFRESWRDPAARRPLFPEALVALLRDLGYAEAVVEFPGGSGEVERDRRAVREYAVLARSAEAPHGR